MLPESKALVIVTFPNSNVFCYGWRYLSSSSESSLPIMHWIVWAPLAFFSLASSPSLPASLFDAYPVGYLLRPALAIGLALPGCAGPGLPCGFSIFSV